MMFKSRQKTHSTFIFVSQYCTSLHIFWATLSTSYSILISTLICAYNSKNKISHCDHDKQHCIYSFLSSNLNYLIQQTSMYFQTGFCLKNCDQFFQFSRNIQLQPKTKFKFRFDTELTPPGLALYPRLDHHKQLIGIF